MPPSADVFCYFDVKIIFATFAYIPKENNVTSIFLAYFVGLPINEFYEVFILGDNILCKTSNEHLNVYASV